MKIKSPFKSVEWYRKPISPLEQTLRFPMLLKEFLFFLAERVFFKIALGVIGLYFLFSVLGFNISTLGLLILSVFIVFVWEMFNTRDWWEKKILPVHLENVKEIGRIRRETESTGRTKLIGSVEKAIHLSVWGMVRTVYMGFPSIVWEVILRRISPLVLIGGDYRDLLIGFSNKNIESDVMLWKISKEGNNQEQKRKLGKYLDMFGSRIVDADLSLPTLRENPKAIKSLIGVYEKLETSPLVRLKASKQRRIGTERKVRSTFKSFVRIVQDNVRLREDRRYYEFLAGYDIRQMLLLLGEKLKLDEPEEIFKMNWKEVKSKCKRLN